MMEFVHPESTVHPTLSLLFAISISAVCVLAIAAYSDVRTLRIPNWISIAVAVLGLLRLCFSDLHALLYTVPSALLVFLIGLALFTRGFIGGGDVKLASATVLLVGCYNLFSFFIIMSICGAMLAVMMLLLKHTSLPVYLGSRFAAFAITTETIVPYGVAIALGGSVITLLQLANTSAFLL